jgi:3-oxoacyl-[acyl-carrier protein] reductase
MIDPGLDGKVAIVTGANNAMGIGAAIARALSAQGVGVFLTYYRTTEDIDALGDTSIPGEAMYRVQQTYTADHVVKEIEQRGGHAATMEADLSDPAIIPQIFDRAEAAFGPVDVLINNAAYCVQDTLVPPEALRPGETAPDGFLVTPITAETHDRHFAVNSRAVALMMAEFARRLVRRGGRWGRIVNISTDGSSAFNGEVSYGASKHALESYSRAAAKELGKFGITVNIASLGPIQTGWIAPELDSVIARNTPLGRTGMPDDVADVVVFLASEQARWLTGQLIYAGGGHAMHQ